jgi:hypothetical protein
MVKSKGYEKMQSWPTIYTIPKVAWRAENHSKPEDDRRVGSCVLKHHIVQKEPDVSEEHIASIFKIKG